MVSVDLLYDQCTPTFSIGNKELKWVYFIAQVKIFYSGFGRFQYYDYFYLTYFFCSLFLDLNNVEFASYADDNTPNTTNESIGKVIDKLEIEAKSLFKWFCDNQMKANNHKYHLLNKFYRSKWIENRQ